MGDFLIQMTIDPRISQAFAAENGFPLEPHLIVLALMGSHSHGTYIPPEEPNAIDDIDLMGLLCHHCGFISACRAGSTGACSRTSWTW